jgi:hypothetical protein
LTWAFEEAEKKRKKMSAARNDRLKPLVILRGSMCSGKSTCYNALASSGDLDGFVFLDHVALKHGFARLGDVARRKLGARALSLVLADIISGGAVRSELPDERELVQGVVIEEMSADVIRKRLVPLCGGKRLDELGWRIVVVQFSVSDDVAYDRNVERRRVRGMEPRSRQEMRQLNARHVDAVTEHRDTVVMSLCTDTMDRQATFQFVQAAIFESFVTRN